MFFARLTVDLSRRVGSPPCSLPRHFSLGRAKGEQMIAKSLRETGFAKAESACRRGTVQIVPKVTVTVHGRRDRQTPSRTALMLWRVPIRASGTMMFETLSAGGF